MPQGLGKELNNPTNYAVSISTGTVKSGPGVLYGWAGTTNGDIFFKDGGNNVMRVAVTAGVMQRFERGINFQTSITVSASAAVATMFYL